MVDELVLKIQRYQDGLDRSVNREDDNRILHYIRKLGELPIKVSHLEDTGVGRSVNKLKRHGGVVSEAANSLVDKWKAMVVREEDTVAIAQAEQEVPENEDLVDGDSSGHGSMQNELEDEVSNNENDENDYHTVPDFKHRQDADKNNKDESHSSKKRANDSDEYDEVTKRLKESNEHRSHSKRESTNKHSSREKETDRHKYKSKEHRSESKSSKDKNKSHSNKHRDKEHSKKRKRDSSTDNESDKESKRYSDIGHHSKDLKSNNKKPQSSESEESTSSNDSYQKLDHKYSDEKSDQQKKPKENKRSSKEDKHHSKEEKHKSKDEKHKSRTEPKGEKRDSKHDQHNSGEGKHSSKEKHSIKPEKATSQEEKHHSKSDKRTVKDEKHSLKDHKHISKDAKSDSKAEKHSSKSEKHKSKEHSSKNNENVKNEKSASAREKEKNKESSTHSSEKSSDVSTKTKSSNQSDGKQKSNGSSSSKDKTDDSKSKPKIAKPKPKFIESIDSESGTSFAAALGMCTPQKSTKNKKKSSSSNVEKPTNSTPPKETNDEDDILPPLLKEPPPTVEPPDINISSLLPDITPNYRPLATPTMDNFQQKKLSAEEALSRAISGKNQRTKIYSGTRVTGGVVPSLFELCIRVLQNNIDGLEYTGGVPYSILKPVLEKATPIQLHNLEYHNAYLVEESDELWHLHCMKDFRTKKRLELESWRDMYLRCSDEREAKFQALTANIKHAQELAPKARAVKFAYLDVVKPPRDVARRQAKFGTGSAKKTAMMSVPRVGASSSSNGASTTSGAAAAAAATTAVSDSTVVERIPNTSARAAERSSHSQQKIKPKKAPLMAKTLSFLKNRFRR